MFPDRTKTDSEAEGKSKAMDLTRKEAGKEALDYVALTGFELDWPGTKIVFPASFTQDSVASLGRIFPSSTAQSSK